MKHQVLDALLRLKTEKTDTTSLHEEVLLLVINETGKQEDEETEYCDQDQVVKEQASNHRTVRTMKKNRLP